MQAIQSLESDYQQSLADLESSYIIAIESLILANNQTLDEINETNAAAFDDLLLSLNSLQTNLQNSQYSIDQISLIVDDLDEDDLEIIRAIIFDVNISPETVKKLCAENGEKNILSAFLIPIIEGKFGLEFVLRMFKGQYYKKRFPNMAILESDFARTS